jgi:hypothetical protein
MNLEMIDWKTKTTTVAAHTLPSNPRAPDDRISQAVLSMMPLAFDDNILTLVRITPSSKNVNESFLNRQRFRPGMTQIVLPTEFHF